MEDTTDKKFLQSYLYTNEFGNFFISTCYRKSSAMLNPNGWYYETFAWTIDGNKERGQRIVADNSGALSEVGALKQLEDKGQFLEPNE